MGSGDVELAHRGEDPNKQEYVWIPEGEYTAHNTHANNLFELKDKDRNSILARESEYSGCALLPLLMPEKEKCDGRTVICNGEYLVLTHLLTHPSV